MQINKKSLSQNFLIDKNICKKIVNLSSIQNKNVFEIGPGKGILTDAILEKNPKKLTLVEKDDDIYNYLKFKYKNIKNIEIINNDFLNINLNYYKNLSIVSNIPYNISSKILKKIFFASNNVNELIMMVQKDFAKKINYNDRKKMNKYKFLNEYSSKFTICFDVNNKVFVPRPKIKSSIVKFEFINKKINWNKLYDFCEIIFKDKRKILKNKINLNNKIININILKKRVEDLKFEELNYIYNLI